VKGEKKMIMFVCYVYIKMSHVLFFEWNLFKRFEMWKQKFNIKEQFLEEKKT